MLYICKCNLVGGNFINIVKTHFFLNFPTVHLVQTIIFAL